MKVYTVIEISSSDDVKASLDTTKAFSSYEDARKMLQNSYVDLTNGLDAYGEVVQKELYGNYYSVTLEEDDCSTIYEGYIRELEVE